MEAQAEELEVLKAIFMGDFEEVQSKVAWKSVNASHEFRIHVRPQEEELKSQIGIFIKFRLPSAYPRVVPSFVLENPLGLNAAQVAELHTKLVSTATSLLGSGEMIYELCSHAASFITDRHGIILRGNHSLGEERQKRAAEENKITLQKSLAASSLRFQADEAEANQLSLLITEDVARKELLRMDRETKRLVEEKEARAVVDSSGSGESIVSIWIDRNEREARVKLGLSIAGDWLGRVQSTELSVGNGKAIAGSAHVFDILSPFFLTSQGKRKLQKVCETLDRVRTIQHPHLSTLYGSLLSRYSPSAPQALPAEGLTLTVLVETIRSQTLQDLLLACGELRSDRALHYLTMLLGALEALHREDIAHGGIQAKMIFIGPEGCKLSGGSWYQRLVNLNKSNPWTSMLEEELADPWICPAALEDPFIYDKARDMWELGVLFSQTVFGLDVVVRYSSPAELISEISRSSSPAVRKILRDLLLVDGRKRATAGALLAQLESSNTTITNLSTTPTTSLSFWPQTQTLNRPSTPIAPLMKAADSQSGLFWQPRVSGSRYRAEFEELEFLGRGGGGQVVKSRNRLDGHLYAIKKIRLPFDRISEGKILREVTLFSRMNHPNIVRYHTSWVETEEHNLEMEESQATDTTRTDPTRSSQESSTPSSGSASDFEESSDDGETVDIDLGLEDLDDNDFLSVGHPKSQSYPRIHFGAEDDASNVNSPIDSTRANSPISIKRIRTLYIQMEYVEKLTLKEAIDEGVSEMDAWRLIFQILSAMLHFTSLNIIHRDLKPTNIFIDGHGDVRIGDFGLAVNQAGNDPTDGAESTAFLSIESSIDEVDLTSGVGTSLYIAPETLSSKRMDRNVKYSNKIDMYSLGIVFFELFQPFKTGMERIHVLRDLRQPEIRFPDQWTSPRLARQASIVRKCLVHDPELRFSPKELLSSDLLPPRVGDESISETIRLLSHSGTQHAQTLINALFQQNIDNSSETVRRDHTYDYDTGQGPRVDNDPFGELVREKLSKIFRRKGAIVMQAPLLMPQSSIYGSRKAVRLLDLDGTVVTLPFQLNIPFCRMVARDASLTRLKRWTIAPVYRSTTGGGQPRAILNAAFDIVSDAVTLATEAEVIYVADEIVGAFPFEGETITFVNHAKILDALVAKVPIKRRDDVLETFVQHGRLQRSWQKTSAELLKITGVSRSMVDEWATLDITGNVEDLRSKLLAINSPLKHLIKEGLDELKEIVNLSLHLGVKNIKLAPLLAQDHDFHKNGLIFETTVVRGKNREVIAAGGRFDDVISQLAAPDVRHSGRCPHAVGFSLAVAKLSACAAESNASNKSLTSAIAGYSPWTVRRCDVFVVSFHTPGMVELRLDIAKDLWKAGINSDLMYDDDLLKLTPEQLSIACRREGILWMVIVKQAHQSDEHILKVKSVLKGYEEEVKRSDLISWLHRSLSQQAVIENTNPAGDVPIESTFQRPKQEVIPIIPDDDVRQKGRNRQKTIFIQKAVENISIAAESAKSAAVYSIDIDGLAFRKMCESARWIEDDESFRAVLNAANPSKRGYLNSIRSSIQKYKINRPEERLIWIFSLRDDRSCLLTLEWK